MEEGREWDTISEPKRRRGESFSGQGSPSVGESQRGGGRVERSVGVNGTLLLLPRRPVLLHGGCVVRLYLTPGRVRALQDVILLVVGRISEVYQNP